MTSRFKPTVLCVPIMLAIATTAVVGTPALGAATGAIKTVYFNNPLAYQTPQSGAPSAITTATLRLLAGAANAAHVHIAMFQASLAGDPDLAADASLIEQELVSDIQRGVTVDVVADYHKSHDFWNQVVSDLGSDAAAQGRFHVTYCKNSCYESGVGMMHNKFMLIDQLVLQTTAVEDMVLQTSANWDYKQLNSHYWNNALEVENDGPLYDGYLRYWTALKTCGSNTLQHCDNAPPSSVQNFSGSAGEFVNVLPQTTPDPVKDALDGITHCSLLSDAQNAHTTIDIAMNNWKADARGGGGPDGILKRLRDLDAAGCPVRIVIPSSAPIASSLTGTDGVSLKAHCTGGGLTAPTQHNKYMLINGSFNSVESQVVFTGSHRFNVASMTTADDIWLRLLHSTSSSNAQNAALFTQYEDNFNQIWNSTPLCSLTDLVANNSDDDSLDP